MVDVVLRCTQDGEFRELQASGHANFAARGNDIVCAAISVLSRTAESFLIKDVNVGVLVNAPQPGQYALVVTDSSRHNIEQLRFLALFLTEGFTGLQRDFPENLSFKQEIAHS